MQEKANIKKCIEIAKGCDDKVSKALEKVSNNSKVYTPKLLEMYGKTRDKYIVIVSKPYTTPSLPEIKTVVKPKSPKEFRKMQDASAYYDKPISSDVKKLIKGILKTQAFKNEANKIFKESQEHDREMGALRVYFRKAMFFVYSVGNPSKNKKNAMSLDAVDPSLGFHVFTWHPHPKGNSEATARSDLKTSYKEQRPGVIKYGKGTYDYTIYMGDLK